MYFILFHIESQSPSSGRGKRTWRRLYTNRVRLVDIGNGNKEVGRPVSTEVYLDNDGSIFIIPALEASE